MLLTLEAHHHQGRIPRCVVGEVGAGAGASDLLEHLAGVGVAGTHEGGDEDCHGLGLLVQEHWPVLGKVLFEVLCLLDESRCVFICEYLLEKVKVKGLGGVNLHLVLIGIELEPCHHLRAHDLRPLVITLKRNQ